MQGMEAYLDEDVVFSSPIKDISNKENTAPHHSNQAAGSPKDTPECSPKLPHATSRPLPKLWALGKQAHDEERVFRFEEEESPAKPLNPAPLFTEFREKRKEKHKKATIKSKWDSDSDRESVEGDKENINTANKPSNANLSPSFIAELDLLTQNVAEIKIVQSKIKIGKEKKKDYKRLVCQCYELLCLNVGCLLMCLCDHSCVHARS
jgi:hypothetical protein